MACDVLASGGTPFDQGTGVSQFFSGGRLEEIDAISAGSVPEPASWALFISGFGLLGGAMRRQRVSVGFA